MVNALKISIAGFFLLPFFSGFILSEIAKSCNNGLETGSFGRVQYFRLLISSIIIYSGVVFALLIALLLGTVFGLGESSPVVESVWMFLTLVILLYTFFYDTAIIYDEEKVISSLQTSIRKVKTNPFEYIKFYVILIIWLFITGFAMLFIWSIILSSRFTSIETMDPAAITNLTPHWWVSTLGTDGVIISIVIFAIWSVIAYTSGMAYKAVFYLNPELQEPVISGEFDEKGRYYRY